MHIEPDNITTELQNLFTPEELKKKNYHFIEGKILRACIYGSYNPLEEDYEVRLLQGMIRERKAQLLWDRQTT